MIVYRELSSIEKDLGIPVKTLYGLSNNLSAHYHYAYIPKCDGDMRKLTVPDKVLKSVQRRIADTLLAYERISPYAKAYRPCSSVILNAHPHVGKAKILKLDISRFFDSILYSRVKELAFPAVKYSENIRILLSLLCYYKDSLPQGAPTSPAISNIVMKDFDDTVGAWCEKQGITYTRYCDDMTFSGAFDEKAVIAFVKDELFKNGFLLNTKKTAVITNNNCQRVTGIVVNDKIGVGTAYRKKIRQEVYFCKKFGVEEHLKKTRSAMNVSDYLQSLLGRISFVLQTDKKSREMLEAKAYVVSELRALNK